ncbi:14 kDa phosphohistidine phosphatase-like [Rhinophrynus dorsalis]
MAVISLFLPGRNFVTGTTTDHIFEKVNPEIQKLGLECKFLGGGKIEHREKKLFGESSGYGNADHSVTVEKLKKLYSDYDVTWSDDKK